MKWLYIWFICSSVKHGVIVSVSLISTSTHICIIFNYKNNSWSLTVDQLVSGAFFDVLRSDMSKLAFLSAPPNSDSWFRRPWHKTASNCANKQLTRASSSPATSLWRPKWDWHWNDYEKLLTTMLDRQSQWTAVVTSVHVWLIESASGWLIGWVTDIVVTSE